MGCGSRWTEGTLPMDWGRSRRTEGVRAWER